MTYAGNLLSTDPANPVKAARKRAETIRRAMVYYVDGLDQIAAAYAAHDWEPLGYESWDAYLDGEFGEDRVRLSRKARESAVAALRMKGLPTRAIGSVLGVDQKTVVNDIAREEISSPERVLGADGKTHPAKHDKPPAGADQPDPTTAPAGPSEPPAAAIKGPAAAGPEDLHDGVHPQPGDPAPATPDGVEGFVPDRTRDDWAPPTDAAGAVTSAVPAGPTAEAPADPDRDAEYRAWRAHALKQVARARSAYAQLSGDGLDVTTVVERADDKLLRELERLSDDLAKFLAEVRALRPSAPKTNLTWMATLRRGINHHLLAGDLQGTACGRSAIQGHRIERQQAEIFYESPLCPRCSRAAGAR